MTESEKMWRGFCEQFDAAVWKCVDDGESCRMVLGHRLNPVVVDIYRQGATMKKFDEAILNEVKKKSGIDLVKSHTPTHKS